MFPHMVRGWPDGPAERPQCLLYAPRMLHRVLPVRLLVPVCLLVLACSGANAGSGQDTGWAVDRFALPATAEGLPGAGPIRRYDWFQRVWRERRSAWAASRERDRGAVVFLGD